MTDKLPPEPNEARPDQPEDRPEIVGDSVEEAHEQSELGYHSSRRSDSEFDEIVSDTADDFVRLRPEPPKTFIYIILAGFTIVAMLVFVGGFLGRFDTRVQLAVIASYSSILGAVCVHLFKGNWRS